MKKPKINRLAVVLLPVGLTLSINAQNIFVANVGNGTVSEFSSDGTSLGTFASGLDSPDGLAFDSSGNLYVVNAGNNTVSEFDSSSNLINTITGLTGPSFIAIQVVPEPSAFAVAGLGMAALLALRRRR